MFKKRWPNRIISDAGFEVRFWKEDTLLYKEGKRKLIMDIEFYAAKYGIAVYKNSVNNWEPPHEKEIINEEKKQQILKDIREALLFIKIKHEIK